MSDEFEKPDEPEVAEISDAIDRPSPSDVTSSDIDDHLREYDEGTRPSDAEPPADDLAGMGGDQTDDLDSLLSQLAQQENERAADAASLERAAIEHDLREQYGQAVAENSKYESIIEKLHDSATAANQQLQNLQWQIWRSGEEQSFREFSADVQKHVPDWLPEDHSDRWFRAELTRDPVLTAAWDLRNVDPNEAQAAYHRALDDLAILRNNPNASPQLINEVMQRGQRAEMAIRSGEILRAARGRCIAEAKKAKRPVDSEVSADVAMISAWMRRGSGPAPIEAPPDLGNMSDREFAAYTRQFGIAS